MKKNIDLTKMVELEITDKGKITLNGKRRKANPLGSPIPVRATTSSYGERHYSTEFLEKELKRNYRCPENANAYIWGMSLNLPEETIAGIQFYRLKKG